MKRLTGIVVMVVLAAGSVSAYGGGGFFQGHYVFVPEYSNVELEAEVAGGYGYGADRDGSRHGGFGLVVHDTGADALIGAFGGVISGSQLRAGPLTLSLNLWSGIGFVNPEIVAGSPGVGYFLEADAEAGFALLPWLQFSVYGGMQALGSFDARTLISGARYSPVVGSRLTWGGF